MIELKKLLRIKSIRINIIQKYDLTKFSCKNYEEYGRLIFIYII